MTPCSYCGAPASGRDHVYPRSVVKPFSRLLSSEWHALNRVPACAICDRCKADLNPWIWLLNLRPPFSIRHRERLTLLGDPAAMISAAAIKAFA